MHLHPLQRRGGPRPWLRALLGAALLLAAAMGAVAVPGHPAAAAEWRVREGPGLRLDYAAQDEALAARLWPAMQADRTAVMERLRMFPPDTLRVVLAPTRAAFRDRLGGAPAPGTLGVYLLGRGTIVLRSPRTDPAGTWDLRGVLRHELAHGIIDVAVAQPIPLWLHEGLAILVSNELSYLDEAQLTAVAAVERLIPLPVLMQRFPRAHGARTLAYSQAASFVRFLLRERGMAGLQRLLDELAAGLHPGDAFLATYGEPLAGLEQRWQDELAGRFSYLTLITSSTLLGGIGGPLVIIAVVRRWLQRRRAYRQWEAEERLRASVRGVPPGEALRPHPFGQDGGANGGSGVPRSVRWRPPRPPRSDPSA